MREVFKSFSELAAVKFPGVDPAYAVAEQARTLDAKINQPEVEYVVPERHTSNEVNIKKLLEPRRPASK
jgi:hypothetical protein